MADEFVHPLSRLRLVERQVAVPTAADDVVAVPGKGIASVGVTRRRIASDGLKCLTIFDDLQIRVDALRRLERIISGYGLRAEVGALVVDLGAEAHVIAVR